MKLKIFGYTVEVYKERQKIDNLSLTLENGRRTGRTTRIVDKLINELFTYGVITVYDHYPTIDSKRRVFKLVLKRLQSEHNIKEEDLILNISKLKIHLK